MQYLGNGTALPNESQLSGRVEKMTKKPTNKTNRPLFSSGPCAKFPNWQINKIETSILGRSHRAKKPKDFINYSVELTSELLEIPKAVSYTHLTLPTSDLV